MKKKEEILEIIEMIKNETTVEPIIMDKILDFFYESGIVVFREYKDGWARFVISLPEDIIPYRGIMHRLEVEVKYQNMDSARFYVYDNVASWLFRVLDNFEDRSEFPEYIIRLMDRYEDATFREIMKAAMRGLLRSFKAKMFLYDY